MKVLHLYPKSDDLIARHVSLLTEGLKQSAEVSACHQPGQYRQTMQEMKPDIVHCHGCWHYSLARAAAYARKHGIRVVITPHGQLEPWVIKQQSLQESITKTLLWQKETIGTAYSIITLGRLERTNFEKLGWNRRVEEIHNAVITNAITPGKMSSLTFAVYQKVMDSNTLEQMNDDSITALSIILKTGIMGDNRWVRLGEQPPYDQSQIDWRRLLIYAEHENIRNYVDYGINLLGMNTPSLDTSKIEAYFPRSYDRPRPLKEIIGAYEGDETNYLMRMIRQISKQPLLLHLIELTRELYRNTVNESQLTELLEEKGLADYASSLMQVLHEQTRLDEGFMPLPASDNKQTKHIRELLTNHLKI